MRSRGKEGNVGNSRPLKVRADLDLCRKSPAQQCCRTQNRCLEPTSLYRHFKKEKRKIKFKETSNSQSIVRSLVLIIFSFCQRRFSITIFLQIEEQFPSRTCYVKYFFRYSHVHLHVALHIMIISLRQRNNLCVPSSIYIVEKTLLHHKNGTR